MLQVRISELRISASYITQRLAVYEAELASLEEDEDRTPETSCTDSACTLTWSHRAHSDNRGHFV